MSLDLQAFTALYDQLEHPVLLFDADTLHYQNQSAITQLPGLTHDRAMEISSGVYRYGASCFNAQVQTIDSQTLVTLLPCDDPQLLSPETLEIISRFLLPCRFPICCFPFWSGWMTRGFSWRQRR